MTRYTTAKKEPRENSTSLRERHSALCEPCLGKIATSKYVTYLFVSFGTYGRFALTSGKMKFHIIRISDAPRARGRSETPLTERVTHFPHSS